MPGGKFELDVLIIVSSDPRYDTRSTKFLKALTDEGWKAKLVGICSDGQTDGDAQNVTRVPVSAKTVKRFYAHV